MHLVSCSKWYLSLGRVYKESLAGAAFIQAVAMICSSTAPSNYVMQAVDFQQCTGSLWCWGVRALQQMPHRHFLSICPLACPMHCFLPCCQSGVALYFNCAYSSCLPCAHCRTAACHVRSCHSLMLSSLGTRSSPTWTLPAGQC